ncbi:hypothetical protein HMPREF9536_00839 [Escherichia coli MS 84-1]|uniref:Uncharacterized protein n=1 Tax=Escherichia coli MS 85-1 TaxID=679202 RepID=A0AAN3M5Y9_ECOLX|nr:hypothetical protein HMPREF9536_00839 [Escherichia coli MS 84-1]EFU33272.1 hypothetical protein HMPREF9350_04877 [Escherichia coli MS 85-1]
MIELISYGVTRNKNSCKIVYNCSIYLIFINIVELLNTLL